MKVLAAILALVLVAVCVVSFRSDAAWRAKVQVQRDSLIALRNTHADFDSAAAVMDAAQDARQAELDRRAASLHALAARLGAQAAHHADSLIATVPDTCLPAMLGLQRIIGEHLAADTLAWRADSAVHEGYGLRIATLGARADTLRSQRDAAMQLAADNLDLARPSRFKQGVALGAAVATLVAILAR